MVEEVEVVVEEVVEEEVEEVEEEVAVVAVKEVEVAEGQLHLSGAPGDDETGGDLFTVGRPDASC